MSSCQYTSFYSEGIITGWGNPQKEKLVQIEFSYLDDGIPELLIRGSSIDSGKYANYDSDGIVQKGSGELMEAR